MNTFGIQAACTHSDFKLQKGKEPQENETHNKTRTCVLNDLTQHYQRNLTEKHTMRGETYGHARPTPRQSASENFTTTCGPLLQEMDISYSSSREGSFVTGPT